MVTIIKYDGQIATNILEIYGKSTDTKPTDGIMNASIFYEMDTKKVYMFDIDTKTWLQQ